MRHALGNEITTYPNDIGPAFSPAARIASPMILSDALAPQMKTAPSHRHHDFLQDVVTFSILSSIGAFHAVVTAGDAQAFYAGRREDSNLAILNEQPEPRSCFGLP